MVENRRFALLADLDKTLHDSDEYTTSAFVYSLDQLGYPLSPRQTITKLIGKPLIECYEALAPGGDFEALRAAHTKFQEEHPELLKPFPHTISTLSKIKDEGFNTAVITSRSRASALENMEATGVARFIDYLVSVDDVENPKPHPEPVQKALIHFNIPAHHAWTAGDSHLDVQAGNRAGTHTIAVVNGKLTQEIIESRPDHIIYDIEEIYPVIMTGIRIITGSV
jgi:pyrophosphatase PpaX